MLGLGLACGMLVLAQRGGRNLPGAQRAKLSPPRSLAAVLASPPGRAAATIQAAVASVPRRPEARPSLDAATRARLRASYARLPLSFELNQGQTDKAVRFLSRGPGYNLFLTAGEAVLTLGAAGESRDPKSENRNSRFETRNSKSATLIRGSESLAPVVLRMKLQGSNPTPVVVGVDELSGKANYFIGNDPDRWRTNVPTFAKVKYQSVYPGVDLVYYGPQNQLEYDFVVAPGADPTAITLEIETRNPKLGKHQAGIVAASSREAKVMAASLPASPLEIDAHGDLVVSTAAGAVRFRKPHIYQAGGNGPGPVVGRFVLKGKRTVGFQVGRYDRTQPLIIDPALTYATYLGGTNDDVGVGIAVNSSGNVFVAGTTGSIDFPTASPYQSASGGSVDVFVAELKPDGSGLVYSTYLGGHGADRAAAMALNSAGNVYLTGSTNSDNFPTSSGVVKTSFGGGPSDAFVVELNPSGSGLVFATYLGGSDADSGQAIAVDASGNVFVTGRTLSADFPTASPLQAANGGIVDAFVAKLNPTGTSLVFSTYLGGGDVDAGQGIALDSAGNILVTGYTYSTNFPTANPLQAAKAGAADAFIAKLNAAGSTLLYSTYLGGSDIDQATAVTVDASDNVYLTGETLSSDFPTTAGAFETSNQGDADAFVAKLNAAGASLVFSTYLGGVDADHSNAIALGPSGNIYLTGYTRSDDFPTAHPFQATFGGGMCDLSPCTDAFVTALNPNGAALVYSTYLGGDGADYGQAIALDSSGNAYVTGSTASDNLTVTLGVVQPTAGGTGPAGDAFIANISPLDLPALSLLPQKLTFADQVTGTTSAAQTVTLTNIGSATLEISDIAVSGDFTLTNNCGGTLDPGGAQCPVQVSFAPTETGDRTGTLTITDNAAGSPHQVSLDGNGTAPAPAVTLSPTSLDFGDLPFNTTSAPQPVTVTNSGTADLTISSVAIAGDFAQTNDCPTTAIAPGVFCTVTVTFTPATATGSGTGTVTITDDASDSPQTVSLAGVGVPDFALTITPTSTIAERGAASTTFTIGATAPESFTGSITLSCTETYATASCAFSPTSITATQTSTLTLSGLAGETGASLVVAVLGTSGSETASVSATLTFSDFWLSAAPPLQNIVSGDSTTYTVTIAPTNGFAETVTLACQNPARDSTCAFEPASLVLDGSGPVTSTVTVTTTPYKALSPHFGRRLRPPPSGGAYWMWFGGLLALLLVAHRWLRSQRRVWARLAAPIAALILFVMLLSSCQDYNYDLGIRPQQDTSTGTKQDNYTLIFTGTYGQVVRYASVFMSVR